MGNPADIKVNKEATEGERQEHSGAGDSRRSKTGYEEMAKLAYAAY